MNIINESEQTIVIWNSMNEFQILNKMICNKLFCSYKGQVKANRTILFRDAYINGKTRRGVKVVE